MENYLSIAQLGSAFKKIGDFSALVILSEKIDPAFWEQLDFDVLYQVCLEAGNEKNKNLVKTILPILLKKAESIKEKTDVIQVCYLVDDVESPIVLVNNTDEIKDLLELRQKFVKHNFGNLFKELIKLTSEKISTQALSFGTDESDAGLNIESGKPNVIDEIRKIVSQFLKNFFSGK